MTSNVVVQARVDAHVKERAGAVLDRMGLTVSDAVRMLLTQIAHEGALPLGLASDPVAHDAWFRAKVHEALADQRPMVAGDAVEAHFAQRRSEALRRAKAGDA